MRALAITVAMSCLGAPAAAQPSRLLDDAVISTPAERLVEHPVHRGLGGRWFVFAGAVGSEPPPRGDPSWVAVRDLDASDRLVNTKVGGGWRRAGVEGAFGYLHRQAGATRLHDDLLRRESMIGVSLSYRPKL